MSGGKPTFLNKYGKVCINTLIKYNGKYEISDTYIFSKNNYLLVKTKKKMMIDLKISNIPLFNPPHLLSWGFFLNKKKKKERK